MEGYMMVIGITWVIRKGFKYENLRNGCSDRPSAQYTKEMMNGKLISERIRIVKQWNKSTHWQIIALNKDWSE